jgi:hypothetical protein
MPPESPDDWREPPRRSTWWKGRGTERSPRAVALGHIAIGAVGLMSFAPFYDSDVQTRGWEWLPYASLVIWVGFVVVGAYGLVKSFPSVADHWPRQDQRGPQRSPY